MHGFFMLGMSITDRKIEAHSPRKYNATTKVSLDW